MQSRFIIILLLGFASGLPLALTSSTLTFWLAESGTSKGAIGLFAVVALPYTLKFLWAPLLDQIPLPLLGRLGRRRGWGIFIQILLALAIVALGRADPALHLHRAAVLALLVGFLAASQDIVIDALRVEVLPLPDQGMGAALIVLGYRLGMLASGAGALYLAQYGGWQLAYTVMAGLLGIGALGFLLSPASDVRDQESEVRKKAFLISDLCFLISGLRRPNWPLIAAFIVLYKLGVVWALAMTSPLYVDLGFTKPEIASISKVFGILAMIAGGFAGGWLVKRRGILPALLGSGLAQMLCLYAFAGLALAGHSLPWLALAIGSENFTGAMATAAFVAYLSSLCNRDYTATHYALLSALAGVTRDLLSAPSGLLAEHLNWVEYYTLVPLASLPGLGLLLILRRPTYKTHP
jgi:PAT family beta-lactamase induction signal transducer AmpG